MCAYIYIYEYCPKERTLATATLRGRLANQCANSFGREIFTIVEISCARASDASVPKNVRDATGGMRQSRARAADRTPHDRRRAGAHAMKWVSMFDGEDV